MLLTHLVIMPSAVFPRELYIFWYLIVHDWPSGINALLLKFVKERALYKITVKIQLGPGLERFGQSQHRRFSYSGSFWTQARFLALVNHEIENQSVWCGENSFSAIQGLASWYKLFQLHSSSKWYHLLIDALKLLVRKLTTTF